MVDYDLNLIIRRLKRDVGFEFCHRTDMKTTRADSWSARDRLTETKYIKSLIVAIRCLRLESARHSKIIRIDDGPESSIYWFKEAP